jgi:hypothetical protein
MYFYAATGNTPAMVQTMVGIGSQYASANLDSKGQVFDGGKTYRLHIEPNVPAKDFWSVVAYDAQTARCCRPTSNFPTCRASARTS